MQGLLQLQALGVLSLECVVVVCLCVFLCVHEPSVLRVCVYVCMCVCLFTCVCVHSVFVCVCSACCLAHPYDLSSIVSGQGESSFAKVLLGPGLLPPTASCSQSRF